MAEIKIEKKASLWWLWALLAALAIGVLLWVVLDDDQDDRALETSAVATGSVVDVGNDDAALVPVADPNIDMANMGLGGNDMAGGAATTPTGPITELATITGTSDGSLAGRDVRLSRVPVGDVVGDASFWVNGADGKKVYVVLNEVLTPNTPIEGRVDVDKGDRVDLVGSLRPASEGAPPGAAKGTKTDPLPAGITHFIFAQSAKVVG